MVPAVGTTKNDEFCFLTMKMMRHILSVAVVVAVTLLPSVSAEREAGKDLLRGLLQAGIEAVGQKTAPASEEQDAPEASASPTQQRVAGGNSFSQALKIAAEQTIDSVKQRYKEEGRAYARELSDVMVERLMHNAHIRSVISTVQLVGAMVAAYLVLVTIILLVSIARLRKSNREILRLLRKKEKGPDS